MKNTLLRTTSAVLLCFGLSTLPASAANRDMVQLQTQVQQLQDAVARLQQTNDERMGVLTNLVQQSADSVNKLSTSMTALQKQLQTQTDAQGGKVDQVSGQVQAMNDSLDEMKARLNRLEKLMQDMESQQQAANANAPAAAVGTAPAVASPGLPAAAPTGMEAPAPTAPAAAPGRRGKPSAGIPLGPDAAAPLPAGPATATAISAPPVEQLYKTAIGDYMSAKYPLAASEFGEVIRAYPDSSLAGNSYYYQGEIDYRAGRYGAAAKNYDHVLEQFPGNNKIPAAHLHKAQALIELKQREAGIRELRSLLQRFPNSPEAVQARSKLNGMGVPIRPRG